MLSLRRASKPITLLAATILTISFAATGLWAGGEGEEQAAAPEREMIANVWGEMDEKPEYGGVLPMAISSLATDQFDPYFAGAYYWAHVGPMEKLGDLNWALPRDQFPMGTVYEDINFFGGELAESWERTAPDTYVFHLRRGVKWHDKPPVNGREFTADDVVYTWSRNHGLGEFADVGPSPYYHGTMAPVESVTALDDYTVEFKTSAHNPYTTRLILGGPASTQGVSVIVPREVIDTYGDMKDWRNVVGTGPFMISDYVEGSTLTYERNPNYWQTDPIFPDLANQLPYLDGIKLFIMPDATARVAALRTGRSAFAPGLSLDQVDALANSNPELVKLLLGHNEDTSPTFTASKPPFDDVRVRSAMQKAIDLDELNAAFFGGEADTALWGHIPRFALGMSNPFDEWPAEVQELYTFDPAAAERLLDEAGYPRGADGTRFSVAWDVCACSANDLDLAQVITSYWDKIGVDVELNAYEDGGLAWSAKGEGKANAINSVWSPRRPNLDNPYWVTAHWYGSPNVNTQVTDATLNAMIDAAMAAPDPETLVQTFKEMDNYIISQVYNLVLPRGPFYALYQPWIKGYRGEWGGSMERTVQVLAYLWIDQGVRAGMGH